jgi:hypothetical protein
MLPTLIPCVIHVNSIELALLFLLRKQFVLFTLLYVPSLGCVFYATCVLSMGGVCGRWLRRALAGPTPVLGTQVYMHSHVLVLVVG